MPAAQPRERIFFAKQTENGGTRKQAERIRGKRKCGRKFKWFDSGAIKCMHRALERNHCAVRGQRGEGKGVRTQASAGQRGQMTARSLLERARVGTVQNCDCVPVDGSHG